MSTDKRDDTQHQMALEARYSTPEANSNVGLYEGAITLRRSDQEFEGPGTVELRWLPSPSIRFEMEVSAEADIDLFASDVTIELRDKWPAELINVEIMGTSMFPAW